MERHISFFLLFFAFNFLYAEIIPATQIQNYAVDQAFTFNSDRSIFEKTWQQACIAINLEPTTVPNGFFCLNEYGNIGGYPQMGDICADGQFKIPGNYHWCEEAIEECPHSGWALSDDNNNLYATKKTCHRPNPSCWKDITKVSEVKLLAAMAYGEAHASETYEEMAGIASAIIRRRDAGKFSSVNKLMKKKPTFSYVVINKNERFIKLMCGDEKNFQKAYYAAKNALDYGEDYSNGGCFWDGYDLKTKGEKHDKYLNGFHYTDPSHNIFSAQEPPDKKIKGRKINGKFTEYNYSYISTTTQGRTIFWKLDKNFLLATGAKQCR